MARDFDQAVGDAEETRRLAIDIGAAANAAAIHADSAIQAPTEQHAAESSLLPTLNGLSTDNSMDAFLNNTKAVIGDSAAALNDEALMEHTRNIQRALAEQGIDTGAIDGKMGPMTIAAMERWAQMNPDKAIGDLIEGGAERPAGVTQAVDGSSVNEFGVRVNAEGMPVDENGMVMYGVTAQGTALVPQARVEPSELNQSPEQGMDAIALDKTMSIIPSETGHGSYFVGHDGFVRDQEGQLVMDQQTGDPANINTDGGVNVTAPDDINTWSMIAGVDMHGQTTVSVMSTQMSALSGQDRQFFDQVMRHEPAAGADVDFSSIPGVEEIRNDASLSFDTAALEHEGGSQVVGDMAKANAGLDRA